MLFAIYRISKPGTAHLLEQHLDEHRAYLKDYIKQFYLGGPLLNDDGEGRCGSLFVMEAPGRDYVEKFLAKEPYVKAGVFESIYINRFTPAAEKGILLSEAGHD